MQITVKEREPLSGVVTINSVPIDISDVPMVTMTLLVHAIGGTTPDLQVTLQTSDNLEDWTTVGTPFNRSTAGQSLAAFVASADPWGRYLRAEIALSGTTPTAAYSLWMNTFPSA